MEIKNIVCGIHSEVVLPNDPSNLHGVVAVGGYGTIRVSWETPTLNPYAVAYYIIQRSTTPELSTADIIGKTSSDFYVDTEMETDVIQYYWVTAISINGTRSPAEGPASALAEPSIKKIMQDLTEQIDEGLLSQSLKEEISRIQVVRTELDALSVGIIEDLDGIGLSVQATQSTVADVISAVESETAERRTEIDNLSVNINNSFNAVGAEISSINTVIVDNHLALTQSISTHIANYNSNRAAVQGQISTLSTEQLSLATQINTAEASLGNQIAAVQTTAQAWVNAVDDKANAIGARYTVNVNANGLVGGFGIYNTGATVEAGFEVDKFWIGSTSANKVKPFILSNGVVYIDTARIRDLGAENIKANAIQTVHMQANSIHGNRITGGTIHGDKITANTVNGDRIIANTINGDRVIANTLHGNRIIARTLTADRLVAGTITAESGVLANAAITTAKIGNLQVDRIKIADDSVTTMSYLNPSGTTGNGIEPSKIWSTTIPAHSIVVFKLDIHAKSGVQSRAYYSVADRRTYFNVTGLGESSGWITMFSSSTSSLEFGANGSRGWNAEIAILTRYK